MNSINCIYRVKHKSKKTFKMSIETTKSMPHTHWERGGATVAGRQAAVGHSPQAVFFSIYRNSMLIRGQKVSCRRHVTCVSWHLGTLRPVHPHMVLTAMLKNATARQNGGRTCPAYKCRKRAAVRRKEWISAERKGGLKKTKCGLTGLY